MQGSTMLNEYKGTADASGTYSYSWISNYDIPSGKYDVLVSASVNGHEPVLEIGSFQVQRQLLVEASLLKDLLVPGDKQTINVKVMDANTKKIVSGANVMAKIGEKNEYNGTADASGRYSYSWNIGSDTPTGKYDVLVSSSAKGYEPVSKTGSFQVQRQQLLVEASLLKDLLVPGDKQTINVKVMDANTKKIVSGANVMAKIGEKNEYNGTADASGRYSYSWNIGSDTPTGKYDVLVSSSAKGYEPVSKTGSFQVQRQLLVEASLLKDLLVPGDKQTINVKVMDANTKEIVSGAAVKGKIGIKKFSSNTDDTGAISYSWDTSPTSGGNSYQISLDVSSKGYPKVTKTVSFKMDKPQNLLAPPISNQENKIVNVNNKDLKNDLESQNKFQQCSNLLSNIGCSTDVSDKPIPNPTTEDKPIPNPNTDDKPIPNPTTEDKPIPNPNTDDKPIPDTDNGIENIKSEKNENENNGYDFLASISN
jgi:archaellum component FlaF (FlaF/FlaG flagellin family)